MQTKKQSFLESVTNTAIGFVISLASSFIIFPLVGFKTNAGINVIVTLYFTVISILRSYAIRRWYNKKKHVVTPVETPASKTCCKRNCNLPIYEFGYCFLHYMDGEMRTGG